MRRIVFRRWLRLGLFSCAACLCLVSYGTDTVSEKNKESTELREKLAPVVEAILQQHCAEDCPSFRVEPVFKTSSTVDQVENLGFSTRNASAETLELKSVAVKVLVHGRVPLGHRQSLKEVLSYRLGNEVSVPVSIHLKELKVPAPVVSSQRQYGQGLQGSPILSFVQELAWPLSLLFLGLLGCFSLLMFLRHRKQMQQAALSSKGLEQTSETKEVEPSNESEEQLNSYYANLINTRGSDLAWWIEERAAASDKDSLARILSILPADALTSQFQFSPLTLSVISSIDKYPDRDQNMSETIEWTEESLKRAHWRRKEEEKNPLVILKRFTDAQVFDVFSSVENGVARAALFHSLPKSRWPYVLSQLSSEERVRLGLDISDFFRLGTLERKRILHDISRLLTGLPSDTTASISKDGALEDFTLYLTEKEGQALWQKIWHGSENREKPLSAEVLLEKLDQKSLAEICMRVDLDSLMVLLNQASPLLRTRVLGSLPKSLQERLSSLRPVQGIRQYGGHTDAQVKSLKARADFLNVYKEFVAEGMIQ